MIEIYRRDLKRLRERQYLNDKIIDLKMKLILRDLPVEKREKVSDKHLSVSLFIPLNEILAETYI